MRSGPIQSLRRRLRAFLLSRLAGPLPEDLFRRSVNRERARSDRSGRPFSVVVVQLLETDLARLRRVPSLVAGIIREIDDTGWFGPEELGVLLPETDRAGAAGFAAKARDTLDAAGCRAALRHYTYQPACEHPEQCGQVACGGRCSEDDDHERNRPLLAGIPDANPPDGRTEVVAPRGLSRMFIAPMPPWKRFMDVVGSLALLFWLTLPMLAIAFLVKVSSPGPVIFRQRRAGIGGRPFWFYKFRTMYVDAERRKQELMHLNEATGPVFKIANDPRITPLGRVLRRTSLDELPQLWNVLKGDMSLVGPRPPTMDEVPKYEAWQRRRLEVIGGLTCIWQVSGRCLIPFDEWMRMDLRYSRTVSLWTDVGLLMRTVGAVLSRRGAR